MTHSSQSGQQNRENLSKILPHQLEPEFSSGEEDNQEVFSESEEEENDSSAHSKFQGLSCDFCMLVTLREWFDGSWEASAFVCTANPTDNSKK